MNIEKTINRYLGTVDQAEVQMHNNDLKKWLEDGQVKRTANQMYENSIDEALLAVDTALAEC